MDPSLLLRRASSGLHAGMPRQMLNGGYVRSRLTPSVTANSDALARCGGNGRGTSGKGHAKAKRSTRPLIRAAATGFSQSLATNLQRPPTRIPFARGVLH